MIFNNSIQPAEWFTINCNKQVNDAILSRVMLGHFNLNQIGSQANKIAKLIKGTKLSLLDFEVVERLNSEIIATRPLVKYLKDIPIGTSQLSIPLTTYIEQLGGELRNYDDSDEVKVALVRKGTNYYQFDLWQQSLTISLV